MDFVEKLIVRHTAAFQKVVAFLCAIGILSLCVLGSFAVPSLFVSAEDNDSYGEYVDDLSGVVVQLAESGTVSKGSAALLGVQLALHEAVLTSAQAGHNFSLQNFTGFGGLYWHNSQLHYAYGSFDSSFVNMSDGGMTLIRSDQFLVRAMILTDGARTYRAGVGAYNNNVVRPTLICDGGKYVTYYNSVVDSGGSIIFPTAYEWNKYEDYSSSYNIGCFIDSSNIPVLYNNSGLYLYFNASDNINNSRAIAGWGDYRVKPAISGNSLPNPDFDFVNNSIEDYIINYFNPWIEEEYPELTIYLWDPPEDPTEDTTDCTECGGCNCIHNITVNVEPTVNVDVNVEPTINVYVENQIPSDWADDYTEPTYPVETIPVPVTTETLPPFEIDDDVIDGLHFWRDLWTSLVWASDYFGVIAAVLLLAIAEWCIWHIGR